MTKWPRLGDAAPIIVVVLVFASLGFIVDYSGEFPLNDDWGFSTPLFWYSEGKGLHLTYWQSMPYLTQLGIGVLWVDLVGFSYESLRVLTLIQAAFSVSFAVCLARVAGLDRATSLLVPMAIAASPVFVGLSFSFMSDISGACFALGACLFLAHSFAKRDGSWTFFLLGAAFFLCAVAIRQNYLSIAVAFLLTQLLFFRQAQSRPVAALGLLGAGAALYGITVPLMQATVGLPGDYGRETLDMLALLSDMSNLKLGAFRPAIESALFFFVGAGALLLPLTPLVIGRALRQGPSVWVILLVASAITFAAMHLSQGLLTQSKSNILSSGGIGPRLVRGEPRDIFVLSAGVTFAGAMLMSCLLALVVSSVRRVGISAIGKKNRSKIGVFLILCGLGIYAPHGLTYGPLFDRYLLVPATLVVIGMFALIDLSPMPPDPLSPGSRSMFIASGGIVLALLIVSTAMTEDFFRWQRARYDLIERAYSDFDATDDSFSGGFEYDNLVRIVDQPEIAKDIVATRQWGAKLFLAHPQWSGGETIETVSIDRLLPFGGHVITLRRSTDTPFEGSADDD